MAIIGTHYTIGTVATQVVAASDRIQQVTLHNHDHSSSHQIFVNGPGVTISNGLCIDKEQTLTINIAAGDALFAISDGTGRSLHVLVNRL
jgi:hypothetical protein